MASKYRPSRIRFRSPLLQALPKVEKLGHIRRLAWRWPLLGIVGFLSAVVLFCLFVQPFGRNGPGWPLYWLHDTIYLPIKGHTFTLYHPDSWVWWGLIFTLIMLWALSFATDRSLILRPHVTLLRIAVHNSLLAHGLLALTRRFARPRFRSRLFFSMVEREQRMALHQLRDKANTKQCNQVAHLTWLLITLNLLKTKSLEDYARAVVCWHEVFLKLEIQANEHNINVTSAQKKLIDILPEIVPPLFRLSGENPANKLTTPSGFDLYGLSIELVGLIQDRQDSLPAELNEFRLQTSPDVWLVEAVDQRRMALMEAQQVLTQPVYAKKLPISSIDETPELTWLIGQLAMSIAINVALRVEKVEIGLAYLEAVEAVRFSLKWSPNVENAFACKWAGLSCTQLLECCKRIQSTSGFVGRTKFRQYVSHARRFFLKIATFVGLRGEYDDLVAGQWQELPRVEHYQCLAYLSRKKHNRLRNESKPILDSANPLLTEYDLAIGDKRSERLYLASGMTSGNNPLLPDFDPDQATKAAFEHESINLPLFRRIDGVLLTFSATVFLSLLIFWFFSVQTADSLHLFEAPVVSQLKDERILFNVRDEVPESPFLDAVLHNDNGIYISQVGGLIHRYDPATGLWGYERPKPGDGLSSHDYILLRSGCGDDPRSEAAESCPEPNVLWAVTESGGLVRRKGRSWEVVVGDAAFYGASGRLMNSQDLTTAAVADDGRWLVVGTVEDGFGVYDLQTHHWLTLPDELMAGLPSLSITRIVWWQDAFYLAGPRGLIALSIRRGSPVLAETPIVQGEIIDLDVGLDGGLWALANVACETDDGDTCLWLGKLNRPNQSPQTIINQRNSYSALNLADLTFAQYHDDKLTLAGEAGIYLYDTIPHGWQRLFVPAVRAMLPVNDGEGFFFAHREGIGLLQDETITTWEMSEQSIVKFLYDDNDVLAFSQQGELFALTGSPLTITEVFVGTQTSFEPEQFVNAVGADDRVLLLSPDGALLHNVSERWYEDIPAKLVPSWLRAPTTRFLNAGANIYAFSPLSNERLNIRTLPTAEFLTADFFTGGAIQEVSIRATSAGVSQVWLWNQGVGVLQSDGAVEHFTPQTQSREIGTALTGFDSSAIVDVTTLNGDLVIASPSGLVTYDQANRVLDETATYNHVRAIESFGNSLLLVTEQGQLLRHGSQSSVNLIGAAEGFAISDAALSDGLLEQSNLYLAGGGRVERYDTNLRQVVERWDLPGQGVVRLAEIVDSKPVALTASRATWGDKELPGEGEVVALSLDSNYIWTMREGNAGRYLMGHPRQNPLSANEVRCFFRTPSAGVIGQIQDARVLPSGAIAVVTDRGFRFYDPVARSWFLGPENILPNGGRLYLLGDYLAAVSSAQDRLWLISLSDVRMPGSCTTERVVLQDVTTITTRAVTINEQTSQAAWITPEEAVLQWQNGQSVEVLPVVSEGPNTNEIQRVYQRGNQLFFTTANTLWRYDLAQRRWQRIGLQFDTTAPGIVAINLESYNDGETVVIQGQNGSFYLGMLSDNSNSVSLSLIFNPPTETFDGAATSLLDVQQRGDMLWTFVSDDQIRYYNPLKRQWESSVSLAQADPTLSFDVAFERGVLVGRDGQTWRVARSQETEPTSFAFFELQSNEKTYLDNAATIWRWQPDGSIWRCPLPVGADYVCTQTHSSFWLNSNQVRRAFAWRNLLVFETDSGFVALNTTSEKVAVLPEELANWPPGSLVRQYGQQLWLYHQNTLLILRQAANGQPAVERITGLSQLIFDNNGRPWGQFGDQWRYWNDIDFVTPSNVASIFAWEKTSPTGIDDAGYPYWWDARFVRDDFVLPPEIDLDRLTGLWRAGMHEWWVLAGTELYHVTEGICHPETLAPFATQIPTPVPTTTPKIKSTPTLPATWTPVATEAITITPIPSSTPTPTFTPMPTATPTPVPVACYVVAKQINMASYLTSASSVLRVEVASNILNFTLEGDRSLHVDRQSGSYQVTLQQNVDWQLSALAQDRWPLVRGNMATLPNGREAYNPITNMTTNQAGELVAVRPETNLKLANLATNKFNQPPPLDVTWLRWNRARLDFTAQTPTGIVNLPRQAVIVNGQLIFEEMVSVLADASNNIYLANEHGLWLHRSSDLRLDDAGIVYQPIALGRSIESAHGRFLVAAGDLFPGDKAVRSPQSVLTTRFGDITLTESIRDRRVAASGITGLSIFTERGFVWDRNRRGLGFSDAGLRLQSDAGIHPVNVLANFDAGPNQLGRGAAVLHYETARGLFLRDDDVWYKHGDVGWSMQSSDPTASRVLFSNSTWEWRLANSTFQVNLTGATHNFDYPRAGNNFTFSSDRLMAVAAHQGSLYLVTEAFFEIANIPDQIGAFSTNRSAPLAVDSLESFRFTDGSTALYRYTGEEAFRWNGTNQRFVIIPASEDPRQKRDLVRDNWLHFVYDRQQSVAVTKRIKVEHIQQGQHWIAFDFERGLFPFDIVTAIAVHQNRLYVGSRAGLQVYAEAITGLNDLLQFYDLRPSPELNTLSPVESVGIPRDNPKLLMSRSAAYCIQTGGSGWTFCSNASLLDWRLRVDTPLWQWLAGPDNRIAGRYYDYQGALIPDSIVAQNGRFPHDQLQDVSICRGRAFTLWQNGWLTVSTDDSLRLQRTQIYPTLYGQDLHRFICLENEFLLSQTTIPAGLYLEGGQDASLIWRYEERQWQPVESAVQRLALIEHADFPPAWEQSRLRLLFPQEERPFTFQHRDLGNAWHDLAWDKGRLAIDHWSQLVTLDGKLWAATPDGLVSFERNRAGLAVLDPDTFLIVREPGTPLCQITDIQQEQEEVWVRCQANSSQVYRGRLDGRSDRNVLTHTTTDPFVEQTFVHAEDTEYWEFRLAGHALGSPGSLRAWLHGEEMHLTGGLFSFDTINSLAFLPDTPVNVGTTEAGWFHTTIDNWDVRDWQRPSVFGVSPQQMIHAGVARTGTELALCLRQTDGSYLRLLPGEDAASTVSCPEYLLDNDLWRYEQEDAGLLITAVKSVGGMGWREMVNGRFTDDVVIGLPSTGRDSLGVFYLFPTQAGVIYQSLNGQRSVLHVAPFPGLDGPPTSVQLLEHETPVYVGTDALYTLDDARELHLALGLPDHVVPLTADYTLDELLRVRWRSDIQSGWILVDLSNGRDLSANLMSIDVSEYGKYIANYERWGNPAPWINTHVDSDGIYFLAANRPSYQESLDGQFDLLVPLLYKDRLILIGREELLSINLEYGLVKMMQP